MTERWRCFVAVALGDATRSALAAAVADWRRQPPADALRWAEPDGWHLTLAFLGSVDADTVPAITDAVTGVAAAHAPMVIPTGRLGAFPRPGSARVLWYGIGDPDGALAVLASDLGGALGVEPGGPFRAHVTLARARRGHVDLRGWIEDASGAAPEGRVAVDAIRLMRSHLGRGPARYETLATCPLGGPAA
jgi:2'-5' RNA ligase